MLNILAYYARSFTRAKWHHSHTETETPPSQPARPCPASGTNWHPQNSGQALYSGWTISIKYKYLLPTTLAHDAGTTPTADYYRFTAHTHTHKGTLLFSHHLPSLTNRHSERIWHARDRLILFRNRFSFSGKLKICGAIKSTSNGLLSRGIFAEKRAETVVSRVLRVDRIDVCVFCVICLQSSFFSLCDSPLSELSTVFE